MAALADFLHEIGVHEITTVVEVPDAADSKPRIAALHDRLQAEIDSLTNQTRELLASNWSEFQSQANTGRVLKERISEEEVTLQGLEGHMSGKDAFLPPLVTRLSAHSLLARNHARSQFSAQALSSILALHSAISTLSSLISSGTLSSTVAALAAVQEQLQHTPEPWITATEAWAALKKWAAEEEVRLEGALVGALEACFDFEGTAALGATANEVAKLTLREWTTSAPGGERLSVRALLRSLDEVLGRTGKTLDSHLARTAKQLVNRFVVPFLQTNGGAANGDLVWRYVDDGDGVWTVSLVHSADCRPGDNPLAELETFLALFAEHSSLLPPSPYARVFTTHLTPPLQSLIISHHLQPSLPSSSTLLPPYLATLAAATSFETSFLAQKGYFAFLPEGEESTREEGCVVREWIAKVDRHWAKRVGDAALVRAREEIRRSDWEGEVVDIEIEVEEPPLPPPPPAPPAQERPKEKERSLPPVVQAPTLVQQEVPKPTTKPGRQSLGTRIATTRPRSPSPPLAFETPSLPPTPSTARPTFPPSSTTPIAMSSALTDADEEADVDADSGDAWGFSPSTSPAKSAEPAPRIPPSASPAAPLPSTTLHPSSHARTRSTGAGRNRAPSQGSEGSGEDAWGFDISEPSSPNLAPTAPAETGDRGDGAGEEGGEDAWGFAEELAGASGDEMGGARERVVEQAPPGGGRVDAVSHESHANGGEPPVQEEAEEAWGFGDEIGLDAELEVDDSAIDAEHQVDDSAISPPAHVVNDSSPLPPAVVAHLTPTAASALPISPTNPTTSALPSLPPAPRHAKKDSLGGWGWEHDDEDDATAAAATTSENGTTSTSAKLSAIDEGSRPLMAVAEEEQKHKPDPRGSLRRTEKMTISSRSRVIVRIVEEVLKEALEIGSSSPYPAFASAAAPLLRSTTSILSLYRATAPVQYGKALASVPAIGMQFANDSMWIGDEVERRWRTLAKGKLREPVEMSEVEHAVAMMRKSSLDWRGRQIAIQRALLMESLDEANGFLYTGDVARYANCERSLREVTHTLERLVQSWKPILNPTALYPIVGGLVNDVLLRVLTEIEDQADISEEESIRLNKLCKILHGLESLFAGGISSVGGEVPIWFKFVFLSELLEASMADVLFLFDHRHLVDFSTDEIAKLVRALFSDSPLRATNLQHIMAGHPDVLSRESSDDEE